MEWYTLIKPIGIFTYFLVFINVSLGLFMKKIKFKNKLIIHKWIGISALLTATLHFILVFVYA